MNQKAFRQLLKRYLEDGCSEEERRIVDQWYDLLAGGNSLPAAGEMDAMENSLWDKIHSATSGRTAPDKHQIGKINWRPYAIAAGFIGVVVTAGILLMLNTHKIPADSGLVSAKLDQGFLEAANNSDSARTVSLEDGSAVVIYPGARLAYPGHFPAGRREVYLDGDAFFKVAKNPARPFYVYNNQIVTQVLGTSFGIRRNKNLVEVAVKTGRVAVYENKDRLSLDEAQQKSNGVIITPNQKVTYYQEERHFVTSIVDQPSPVAKEPGAEIVPKHFNYNETPLYKVLGDLQGTYELEIVLENEKIKNCLFTGDLSGQSLFNKLEGICLVFNASYEIKGTKILLKGGKECS